MNILITEDHPMTINLYENLIINATELSSRNIFKATNCKDAYQTVIGLKDSGELNLAILDYSVPPYPDMNISSGGDIAHLIRKHFKACKIFIMTSHTQILLIYDIIKTIKPEGIACKNDISADNFIDMINEVYNGNTYKSPRIKQCLKEIWNRDIMIEEYNRQIIGYLSKGYHIKDIENILPLSLSAIQKRIQKMKKIFNAEDSTSLVRVAIEENYL